MTSSEEAATADRPPTIYEWAGGRDAFRRWLDAFYDAVEADELLAPLFGGKVSEEHRDHVTTWWCEVMGGPAGYTAHHGGYERMLGRHRGLAITPEQRLRFVTLLSRAADAAQLARRSGVPGRDHGLRRVGHAARAGELAAGRPGRPARARAAVGLGRGAAVPPGSVIVSRSAA